MCSLYRALSDCVLGPLTAGPLLLFSNRNCIPDLSVTSPITPSRASISLTRWPLPKPPIAGLHDISPIVSILWVKSAVLTPILADAAAASQPACPPPITTTSKFTSFMNQMYPSDLNLQDLILLFTDTEVFEDRSKNFFDIYFSNNTSKMPSSQSKVFSCHLYIFLLIFF